MLEHPVLDELATNLSREYIAMLGRMNEAIAGVLGRAHGVSKSEGLYVIPGGLSEENIVKAKPKAPAAKTKTAKDVEADKKRREAGVKNPGIRGGKWWRDKNGHVRYGTKPTDDDNAREWEALDEEEVAKLHENINVVYNYHSSIRSAVQSAMTAKGYDTDMVMALFRDASTAGLDIKDYWKDLCEEAGINEKDGEEALSQMFEAYRGLLEDPKFRQKARQAVQKRQLQEQHAHAQLRRSEKYSDGKTDQILNGNVKDEAIRLLALMSDMELLHIPHTAREAGETFVERKDAKRAVGNIVPNKERLQALYSRLDDTNGTQALAIYIAQMFRDMREGGIAFQPGGDVGTETDGYFKDGDKFKDVALNDEGKSDVERANKSLNVQLLGPVFGADEFDDEAAKKGFARTRELASEIYNYVRSFNEDSGGAELGLILTQSIAPDSLFKDDDAIKRLAEKVAAQKALIESSLAAQEDTSFATPKGVADGFKAQGQGHDLFPYQRQALSWMTTIKRGILAYDTGMGKTPMSISMIAHLQELAKQGKISKGDARGIMVMPLGLTKQWPGEIRKFFPDAKVVTIGDDVKSADDRVKVLEAIQRGDLEADFVILSSSVVNFHEDTRASFKGSEIFEENDKGEVVKKKGVSEDEFITALRDHASGDKLCTALRQLKGCVFFDEAHHEQQGLKTATNTHNAAAREFLKDREHSFLLTATPMPNGKPEELFELMDLINPGSAGPDVKKFENKMMVDQVGINEEGAEEITSVADWGRVAKDVQPYVFRKNKLDPDVVEANKKAGQVLPRLIGDEGEEGGATHGLVAPPSFARLFELAGDIKPHDYDARQEKLPEKDRQKWVPASEIERGGHFKVMHQQQMLSVSPRLVLGDDPAEWKKHGYDGSQPKLEHLAELVKAHFNTKGNEDKPMVVFSQWPGSFKYAKEELLKHNIDPSLIGEIHGGVDVNDRAAMQDAVNAGKIKVLFVGTQAGGAGLNLQKKSNKMVFLDQPFMIGHKQQALGRVWRTGQKSDVEVINMYLKGTFDQKKIEGLGKKVGTDVAMSSAYDETLMSARMQQQLAAVLGGDEGIAAAKIENTPDSVLQERIRSKGLQGLVTPKDLRFVAGQPKFNLKEFSKTVEYKEHLDFRQESLRTKRMLLGVKHKDGDITREEYRAGLSRVDKEERDWVRENRLLGRTMVPSPEMEPTQPEPTYVLSPNSTKVPTSKLSPTAQAVLAAVKKTKGGLTLTDFIDDHLKAGVDAEVKRNAKGEVEDHTAHLASAQKWWDNRDDVEKVVKEGLKELDKLGIISTGGSTHSPKASETPLPQSKKPDSKATPAKGKVKAAPEPEHPEVKAPSVNYMGGWAYKLKGPHTETKEYKKHEVDMGGGVVLPLKAIVEVVRSSKKKPASMSDWSNLFEEALDKRPTDAMVKRFIKTLHDFGLV